MGINGDERPADLDADKELIARVRELRGKAAQQIGMCKDWRKVDEECPMMPMTALMSPATNPECHIQSRLFLDNRCHTSMAGTGATCTAACSRIRGSIVNELMTPSGLKETVLNIQHPMGYIDVVVKTKPESADQVEPEFETLSFVRTSRRIMDARLYVPDDVLDCLDRPTNGVNGMNGHANGVNGTMH